MKRILHVAALAFLISGCGYALAGRTNSLPDHIKRIGIPAFENQSSTSELDRLVTEAVRAEFQTHRQYQVVPEATGVDAVLKGTIRTVTTSNVGFTAAQQASRIQITVLASAEFRDLRDNKVLWSNESFRNATDYDLTSSTGANDLASIFTQDRNALMRIAQELAKSLVTQILDNF